MDTSTMEADSLRFQIADDQQRRAAHANVHDVWSRGLPLDQHVERREGLPLNRRATWYVGTLDGRVVTSLGSHPLVYMVHGQQVAGFGIAAVHTLPEFRGRGFAPRLIAFVEDHQRRSGARLSMLFSDVDPNYYARQGYLRCPAHRGTMPAADRATAASYDCTLAPCNPHNATHLARMGELFASSVAEEPFYVIRTPEYAQHLIDRFPDDEFFWLQQADTTRGFVRCYTTDRAWMIRDFAVEQNDAHLRGELFACLAAVAQQRGLPAVVGWVPHDEVSSRYFDVVPRPQEVTMLKPLDASLTVDEPCCRSADRIAEIDHV